MRILNVDNRFDGKKLIAFLQYSFPNASLNVFYKALREKDIRINGTRVRDNVLLHFGDEVKVFVVDELLFPLVSNFDVPIVFEDENVLLVNKSKGIEVTGERSLTVLLQDKFGSADILPCHRLDRNTSGIVVFAKNAKALEILLEKFKNHEVSKFYKCKVLGILDKKHDVLSAFLFKDSKKSLVFVSDTPIIGYRKIVTEYRVLSEDIARKFQYFGSFTSYWAYSSNSCSFGSYRTSYYWRSASMEIIKLIKLLVLKRRNYVVLRFVLILKRIVGF